MPIHREPEASSILVEEASAVRMAPLEHEDDAHELQEHEFTLEPEEPDARAAAGQIDEHTAPWCTLPLPPLPAWAATARALLEPPTAPNAGETGVFYDDQPTPAVESVALSASELHALRAELALATRESRARAEQIVDLERALVDARDALMELERRFARESAHQLGHIRGQAFRIAELEVSLSESRTSLRAAETLTRRAEESALEAERVALDGSSDEVERVELDGDAEGDAEPASGATDTMELTARDLEEASDEIEPWIGATRIEPIEAGRLAEVEAAPDGPASSVLELDPTWRSTPPAPQDDLTQIRGIGSRHAQRLGELGVSTFAHVAAWTPVDVKRIGEQLGIGAKRVQHEAWVKQARKFHTRAQTAGAVRPAARRTRKRA